MNANPIQYKIDNFIVTLQYSDAVIITAFNKNEFDGNIVEIKIYPDDVNKITSFIKNSDELYGFLEEQFSSYPDQKSTFCFTLIIKDNSLVIHFVTVPTIKYINHEFDIILTKTTTKPESKLDDKYETMTSNISELKNRINKLEEYNSKLLGIINSKISECNEKQYANIYDIKNEIDKIKSDIALTKSSYYPKKNPVYSDVMKNMYSKTIPIHNDTIKNGYYDIPVLNETKRNKFNTGNSNYNTNTNPISNEPPKNEFTTTVPNYYNITKNKTKKSDNVKDDKNDHLLYNDMIEKLLMNIRGF